MGTSYTAVLDRIVDGETAVLLFEDDGGVVDERSFDLETLPTAGRHEGAVFEVTTDVRETESHLELQYRDADERKRRERARDRFDRLSERLPNE
ncbi:DUF3006 family protein [Halopiger djelfimassiliensis]|uniref:DUF3006 family protein n=1 Tax=Halopiger djelfimassiliensis TaxID=1293047 RepID=UPI0006782326|nr:DUF3006 family protein [Halopiger djelfimassiliensis]